jgi:hypothetical protein
VNFHAKGVAIASLLAWHRCQDLRVRNRFLPEGLRPRHRASPFPLTPLLRCDHCGGSMRGKQASRVKGVSRYYVCSQRALYGTCAAPIVRADILEEELCRWLGTCHPTGWSRTLATSWSEGSSSGRPTGASGTSG